jgi:flavin reductase (DIM6/NTAB) family NADH-FMN oxidoreductase RutF
MAFPIEDFKQALGRYASGVVVVAVMTDDGPVGFTCQSFSSLSLTPPLVMFAAAVDGNSWSKMRSVSAVGISVLGHDDEAVAVQFATSGIDKFAGVAWHLAPNGAPLITGACAHVSGQVSASTTYGDHDLVVVAVDALAFEDSEPFVYYRGQFRRLA